MANFFSKAHPLLAVRIEGIPTKQFGADLGDIATVNLPSKNINSQKYMVSRVNHDAGNSLQTVFNFVLS